MCSVTHVCLVLRPPKHGWLPLRLELDEFVLEKKASETLNSPVKSLLDLFEFTLAPTPQGPRVCVWLEPDGYAIDVSSAAEGDRCELRISYDRTFIPPVGGPDMTAIFEGELETATLRSALSAALAGLFEEIDASGLDPWGRGYEDFDLKAFRDRYNLLLFGIASTS